MAGRSWMAPVSLFTIMQEARMVFSLQAAAIASGVICPLSSGATVMTSKPSFSSALQMARTEWCSTAVVTMRLPRRFMARAAPSRAILLLSVPPPVKMISSGRQCSTAATCPRASVMARSAKKPRRCSEEGLPYSSVIMCNARAAASGETAVVALLSR